ncbi:hypothetical protein [Sphingomonas sp. 28-63-12]|uniref:hypothetical protein n=1 Tax=Sphingomonas sp. 28-63-12 TaxID=1970434 RepID=UPI000BD4B019|nr:MAG: hypothetical protein B7Y47_00610 [Sphingomonas sp. 28-63-12]
MFLARLAAPLLFVRFVLQRDWRALSMTLMACAAAAVIGSFQYSVYASFVRSSAITLLPVEGHACGQALVGACGRSALPFSQSFPLSVAHFAPLGQARDLAVAAPREAIALLVSDEVADLRPGQLPVPSRQAPASVPGSARWSVSGADIAIALGSCLAGVLMAVLIANGILRFLQRYRQDLIALIGHGAQQRDIALIVCGIAYMIVLVTMAAALLLTPILVGLVQPLLPWAQFHWADSAVPLAIMDASLVAALVYVRRTIRGFGPELMFGV